MLHIWHGELRKKKLFYSTIQQNLELKQIHQYHLNLFDDNETNFVTMQEIWINMISN